ncbi:MAG: hypothetical protein E6G00_10380 [Actinobacteria bacterium]|nr:MAG: hypothetical protein E6G00_10380 [Actinomycetota bacterium]
MRAAAAALGARLFPRPGELVRAATDRARGFQLSPRSRRRLALAILLVLALGALYMLWLRDSSFVRVERVRITGVTGRDAGRLRARLRAAALRMTTLHADEQALMRSLGANSGVRALRVESNFPHALRIAVVQELPVAVLVSGGDRVPVAAQGVLLPAMSGAGVPAIDVGTFPSHGRLGRGRALRLVSCAAAAPPDLLPRVDRIRELPDKGLVAYLRNGPQVIFGSAEALDEKWAAAAAVLADGSSRGASYIDVRMPDRPVAGGLVLGFAPQDQVTGPGAGVGAGAAGAGGAAGSATAAGSAAAGGVSATGASAGAAGATASPGTSAPLGATRGGTASGAGAATSAGAGATRSYPGASASPSGTAGPGHP